MNSPQLGLRVAGSIFGLMALAHLLRLIVRFRIDLAGHAVPLWLNSLGFFATGLLCLWLWRLSLPAESEPPPAA